MASKTYILTRERGLSPWRFWTVAAITLLFDQLTKLAVIKYMPFSDGISSKPIEIINNYLYLVHVTNEGAAWGILSGQTYLLSSIAIMALAALWLFRKSFGFESKFGQIILGMFAGGVVGNLIDRIIYGHVVDFIDVYLPFVNYRWPAFNIADCGISISVTLYIVSMLYSDCLAKRKN